MTPEILFIRKVFVLDSGEPHEGADGKAVTVAERRLLFRRRLAKVSAWAGGGIYSSGARFAQGMRESVLVTDRNRLYHGGQLLLPKRDEPREGRPAATTPPKSAPAPFGSYLPGGMPGGWGCPEGEGDGGGCWHSLCCAPIKIAFAVESVSVL